MRVYSQHAIRNHAMINDLVRRYSCTDPCPGMLQLEVSTGYIHSRILVRNVSDGSWHFATKYR